MFDLQQQAYDLGYRDDEVAPRHGDAPTDRRVVQPGFQFPRRIWAVMIGCYAIFFAAMTVMVGGHGVAMFMVTVSLLYTMMYFGTAAVLTGLAGRGTPSPLDHGKALPTWCGPMSAGSVYAQVLIVPLGIALFGIALLLISMFA